MLTHRFYDQLAAFFHERLGAAAELFVAVGAGETGWDETPPVRTRDTTALTHELARQRVTLGGVGFIDEQGNPLEAPAPRLRVSASFGPGQAVGTLRECGLYADAGPEAGSGILLAYYIHPRLEKTAAGTLTRSIRLDLTPRPGGGGSAVTRYLGNSNSREFHDLENVTGACQVDEIAPDRRVYYATREAALAAGYDFCAFCFGRALSQR